MIPHTKYIACKLVRVFVFFLTDAQWAAHSEILRRRVDTSRLVHQHNAEQRTVDFEMPIIVNEARFTELVHEMADA